MHWSEILALSHISHRAAYLKSLALVWGVEVNRIVEIGVDEGKNAKFLRLLFPHAHLYLVDPWSLTQEYADIGFPPSKKPEHFEKAYKKVIKSFEGDHQVTILRMPSLAAACKVPGEIDLVFIDGDHAYESVKQDITAWMLKVRKGGILSGHDYDFPDIIGVKQAVDELLGEQALIGRDYVWAHLKQ